MPSTVNPPAGPGRAGFRQPQLPGLVRGPQQVGDRKGQRCFGEIAQRRRHLLQPPNPSQIGNGSRQRDDALGLPQRRHNLLAPAVHRQRAQSGKSIVHHALGTVRDERPQTRGLAHREVRQIRAVAADRRQHGLGGRALHEASFGTAAFGEALDQAVGGGGIVTGRTSAGAVGKKQA